MKRKLFVNSIALAIATIFAASASAASKKDTVQGPKSELVIISRLTTQDMPYTITAAGLRNYGGTIYLTPSVRGILFNIGIKSAYPAQSVPGDIEKVMLSVFNGAKGSFISEANVTFSSTEAVAMFDPPIVLEANVTVTIAITTILSRVGPGQPGRAGDRVGVVFNNTKPSDTVATTMTGKSLEVVGESQRNGQGLFSSVPNVQVFKWTNVVHTGYQDLHYVSITGQGSCGVDIGKMTARLSGNIPTKNVNVFVYEDMEMTSPVADFGPDGRLTQGGLVVNGENTEIYPETPLGKQSPVKIPQNRTYYFAFKGEVTSIPDGGWLSISLLGDDSYQTKVPAPFEELDKSSQNNFLWAPSDDPQGYINGWGVQWLQNSTSYYGGGKG